MKQYYAKVGGSQDQLTNGRKAIAAQRCEANALAKVPSRGISPVAAATYDQKRCPQLNVSTFRRYFFILFAAKISINEPGSSYIKDNFIHHMTW